jgi:hypothetical protein
VWKEKRVAEKSGKWNADREKRDEEPVVGRTTSVA